MDLTEIINNPKSINDEYLETFVNIQIEILSNHVPLLNRIKDKFVRKLNLLLITKQKLNNSM